MTKAEAAALQAKWKQRVDAPSCAHPIQHLAGLARHDDGPMGTYYCADCGEEIYRRHETW